MITKLAPYNKFIVALIGAIAQVVYQYFGDNMWVQMALAVLTALGVFQIKNKQL